MFSVVIPVYNKASYLAKSIQSVKDQTFNDWELILVDDGSTDSSVEVINESIAGYNYNIKLFSQSNQGVSTARNNGVVTSKFEYLAFLDADDWWEPGFLEGMAFLINNYPNAAWFASDYFYVKHGQKTVEYKGLPLSFTSGYLDFIKTYSSSFCTLVNCSFVVVKKDVFLKLGGFKKELRFGEDIHLWLQLACSYPLAYCAKPLSNSFQDVDSGRAIGWRIYPPASSFLFNLDDIELENPDNKPLKFLTDGLRIRGLWKYRLSGKHKEAYNKELAKVDWTSQPALFKKYYTRPIVFWKLYWFVRKVGAAVKGKLYSK
jgi:glycosyltransferase involved in cell wall biosynthesis